MVLYAGKRFEWQRRRGVAFCLTESLCWRESLGSHSSSLASSNWLVVGIWMLVHWQMVRLSDCGDKCDFQLVVSGPITHWILSSRLSKERVTQLTRRSYILWGALRLALINSRRLVVIDWWLPVWVLLVMLLLTEPLDHSDDRAHRYVG